MCKWTLFLGDLSQAHANILQHIEHMAHFDASTIALGQRLDTFSGQFHALSALMATQIASNLGKIEAVDEKLDKFIEYVDGPLQIRLFDIEHTNIANFGATATQDHQWNLLEDKVPIWSPLRTM